MKKNKKNLDKNKKPLLQGAAKSLRKLNRNSLGKLSTTQKILAGTTLGILGARYLLKKLKGRAANTAAPALTTDATEAGNNLHSLAD